MRADGTTPFSGIVSSASGRASAWCVCPFGPAGCRPVRTRVARAPVGRALALPGPVPGASACWLRHGARPVCLLRGLVPRRAGAPRHPQVIRNGLRGATLAGAFRLPVIATACQRVPHPLRGARTMGRQTARYPSPRDPVPFRWGWWIGDAAFGASSDPCRRRPSIHRSGAGRFIAVPAGSDPSTNPATCIEVSFLCPPCLVGSLRARRRERSQSATTHAPPGPVMATRHCSKRGGLPGKPRAPE